MAGVVSRSVRYFASATIPIICISGPGVPDEHLGLIFDRYFSHRPARSPVEAQTHFGIGLWVARRNVEATGGSIEAENRRPHGLLVRVRLPLAATLRLTPAA